MLGMQEGERKAKPRQGRNLNSPVNSDEEGASGGPGGSGPGGGGSGGSGSDKKRNPQTPTTEFINVKLTSKDLTPFLVPKEACRISNLLKKQMQEDPKKRDFPLPQIKGNILQEIIKFMIYHQSYPMQPIEKPLQSTNMHEVVSSWDADFVDIHHESLFEIMCAAEVMEIEDLLELCSAKMASMMKSKNSKQLREIFRMESDMDTNEETAAKQTLEWVLTLTAAEERRSQEYDEKKDNDNNNNKNNRTPSTSNLTIRTNSNKNLRKNSEDEFYDTPKINRRAFGYEIPETEPTTVGEEELQEEENPDMITSPVKSFNHSNNPFDMTPTQDNESVVGTITSSPGHAANSDTDQAIYRI